MSLIGKKEEYISDAEIVARSLGQNAEEYAAMVAAPGFAFSLARIARAYDLAPEEVLELAKEIQP
ncbi:MAG TPA: hypothetical protein VJ246_03520 [Patescibacteria group bacterium]|nr:hypothetical protein [Patescibacteria group bacterium]